MRLLTICKDCGNAKDVYEHCQYCLSGSTESSNDSTLAKSLPNKPKPMINKIAWIMVGTPALAAIIGYVLEFLIPGCECSGLGNSCTSCYGFEGVVYFLKYIGLGFTGFAIVLGLPVLFFIGFIATIIGISKNDKP
jgi:hypothetical protein